MIIKTFIMLLLPTMLLADTELDCLAKVVYYEARGEPIEGQFAVAYVVLNRVADHRFPDQICEVVYQPGQFSWTDNEYGISSQASWNQSELIAKLALTNYELGLDNTHGAIYFSTSRQSYHKQQTRHIGGHRFFI